MRFTQILCACVVVSGTCAAQIGPGNVPEVAGNSTGFATPETALQSLRARRDVTFKDLDGWLVALDAANQVVWLFAPQGHPAYPSAVKRSVIAGADGMYYFKTAVQCEGTKVVCDQLVFDYQRLDVNSAKR